MAYPMPPKNIKSAEMAARPMGSAAGSRSGGESSWVKGLVTLIIVLVILGGGVYLVASYTGIGTGLIPGTSYFQNTWQAVFLTNGQVYFGKVAKITPDSVFLRDIYYLQVVTQPLQRSQDEPAPTEAEQQGQQRLTLIKLGNELHGPRDEMIINRNQVILMEDLKEDSRVVQAIADSLANQGGGN